MHFFELVLIAISYFAFGVFSHGGDPLMDDLNRLNFKVHKTQPIDGSEFIDLLSKIDKKYIDQYFKDYAPYLRPLTKDEKEDVARVVKSKLRYSDDQTDALMTFIRAKLDVPSDIPADRGKISPNSRFIRAPYYYNRCDRDEQMNPRRNPDPRRIAPPLFNHRCGITRDNVIGKRPIPQEAWQNALIPKAVRKEIDSIKSLEEYWEKRPEFSELSKDFVCHYLDPYFGYSGFDDTCFGLPIGFSSVVKSYQADVDRCREGFVAGVATLSVAGGLFIALPITLTLFDEVKVDNVRVLLAHFLMNLVYAGWLGGMVTLGWIADSDSCARNEGVAKGLFGGAITFATLSTISLIRYLSNKQCSTNVLLQRFFPKKECIQQNELKVIEHN